MRPSPSAAVRHSGGVGDLERSGTPAGSETRAEATGRRPATLLPFTFLLFTSTQVAFAPSSYSKVGHRRNAAGRAGWLELPKPDRYVRVRRNTHQFAEHALPVGWSEHIHGDLWIA